MYVVRKSTENINNSRLLNNTGVWNADLWAVKNLYNLYFFPLTCKMVPEPAIDSKI